MSDFCFAVIFCNQKGGNYLKELLKEIKRFQQNV